ncbi:MAG: HEAT repeat domain-containing protein, partial [Rhodopirellula bahusiensis]
MNAFPPSKSTHRSWTRSKTRMIAKAAFATGLICLPFQAATADTLLLSTGGQLTGKVREVDSKKTPYVLVQVDQELSVAIAKANSRMIVGDEKLNEYRRQVVEAGQDGQAHYELATWCRKNNLLQQRKYHLIRTIDLLPDHPNARAALGYTKRDGKWIL